ncbi:hypothetical protein BCR35DRAFT_352004 [Leucosporidium creatinivorum]|uniref:Zn(2)-C6 fungal-type domain-containing protein n=1 Tax=Leucosporidium creatinivorum TaxID=106004 RepID=A0A1Y2FL87_9BASI|nr:hypothetical protein BCR35DRAFT_352004 [Leucosporidium creatinivorum]
MASALPLTGRRTRQHSRFNPESDLITHNEQQQEEGDASSKSETTRIRRRRATRVRTSCEPCRARKVRCDRQRPCFQCKLHHDECYYTESQPLSDIGEEEGENSLTVANAEIERLGQLVQSLNAQSGRSTTRTAPTKVPRVAQRFRDVATPPRLSIFTLLPLGDALPRPPRERPSPPYTIRRRYLTQSLHISNSIRSSLASYGYQSPIERFGGGKGGSPSRFPGATSFVRTGSAASGRERMPLSEQGFLA